MGTRENLYAVMSSTRGVRVRKSYKIAQNTLDVSSLEFILISPLI